MRRMGTAGRADGSLTDAPPLPPLLCVGRLIAAQVDPLISYYCRLYALQLGMKIANKSKDDLRVIGEQMAWLESHQSLTSGLSKEEGRARCEAFALQVFEHGDTEDRAGLATKKTALNFHAAYVLLDMCRQFGTMASDVEEKLRYAVVKAADINKCLKEGRKPKAGPLVDTAPEDDLMDGAGNVQAQAAPHFNTAASPFTGTSGAGWPSAASSSSSSSASAPAPFSAESAAFPAVPSDASAPPPSAPFNPHALPSGPAAQPSQPAQPSGQQPSLFGRPSAAAAPSSTPSPPTGSSRSATGPSPFSAEASAARAAAAAAAGHAGGAFTRKDTRKLDAVRDGERLIKHALSAVVFSDVDTTVAKLREALQILQPFTTTSPQ